MGLGTKFYYITGLFSSMAAELKLNKIWEQPKVNVLSPLAVCLPLRNTEKQQSQSLWADGWDKGASLMFLKLCRSLQ